MNSVLWSVCRSTWCILAFYRMPSVTSRDSGCLPCSWKILQSDYVCSVHSTDKQPVIDNHLPELALDFKKRKKASGVTSDYVVCCKCMYKHASQTEIYGSHPQTDAAVLTHLIALINLFFGWSHFTFYGFLSIYGLFSFLF